jgi:hypothetical protein
LGSFLHNIPIRWQSVAVSLLGCRSICRLSL